MMRRSFIKAPRIAWLNPVVITPESDEVAAAGEVPSCVDLGSEWVMDLGEQQQRREAGRLGGETTARERTWKLSDIEREFSAWIETTDNRAPRGMGSRFYDHLLREYGEEAPSRTTTYELSKRVRRSLSE